MLSFQLNDIFFSFPLLSPLYLTFFLENQNKPQSTNLRGALSAPSLQSYSYGPVILHLYWIVPFGVSRPPHPWNPSGKNNGVGCHFLLQGINPGNEPRSPALQADFFPTSTTRKAHQSHPVLKVFESLSLCLVCFDPALLFQVHPSLLSLLATKNVQFVRTN